MASTTSNTPHPHKAAMTTFETDKKDLTLRFLFFLGCYFTLHIALRITLADSLDYDEAEQIVLSQWLLPGYTEQPPLYTWVQYYLFQLFGKTAFAISLFKNSLLFLTYCTFYFSARQILQDNRSAILATVSLLLIPQIAWESQRDMTHTTLVLFAASATLMQTLRTVRSQSVINYGVLGLSLGIGILAKANYALFLVVLIFTLISLAEGRKVVFSIKIWLSLFIALAVSGIYLFWISGHLDIVFSATDKFTRLHNNYPWRGLRSLGSNSVLFLTPLWLIYLLIFPKGFQKSQVIDTNFNTQFFKRYFLFLMLILLAMVLAMKVAYVKDRWLQPLLFTAPIFFFKRLPSHSISSRQFKIFLGISTTAALAIYLALTFRVVGVSYTKNFCRLNFPFAIMAEDIRKTGFSSGLIISNNRFIAGNMHIQFPDTIALIPGYNFETLTETSTYTKAVVIWDIFAGPYIPQQLSDFVEKTYNIKVSDYPVQYFEHRYTHAQSKAVVLATMQFPIPLHPKNNQTTLSPE
jgi:hypothetical protein